jgi:hypothetical protein
MRKLIFLILICLTASCSISNKSSSSLEEDRLIITRKYIGNFIEYYHTGPQIVGGKDLIWIKTTVYSTFGKISAYGKTCRFSAGERIYLKPTNITPPEFGNWEYQIENDSSVFYKVSEYRFENNVFTQTPSL